jgi:hypothetical protein
MKQRATSAAWATSRSGEEGEEQWEEGSSQGGSPLPRAKDLTWRIKMAQVTAIMAAAGKVDTRIVVWRGPQHASGGNGKGILVRKLVEWFRQPRNRSLHVIAGE